MATVFDEPATDSSQESEFSSRPRRLRRRSGVGRTLLSLLLVVLVGAGAVWALSSLTGGSGEDDDRGMQIYEVAKRDLLITVTDDGFVESASNVDIKCEVAGGGTIIWIIPDGTEVEAGQELVRLDTSLIEEQLNAQKGTYEQAVATQIQSKAAVDQATTAVREYKEGLYIQTLQTADANIQIAKQNLTSAENTLEFSERMVRKGFATPLQLKADEFAVERAKLELDAAETNKKVLVDFTYEKTLLGLASTREAAAAKLRSDDANLELQKGKLEHLQKQLENCVIKAPANGMVVYANDNRSRYGSSSPTIEEGASVRERQSIIKLPDLTKMQVKTTVHESKIDQIRSGKPARILIQGKEHQGHVVSIANQPEPIGFMSANVKEYATVVAISGTQSGMRPGMTAQVEILIDELHDALTVPVSSVVEKRTGFFCYVKPHNAPPEERKLVLGRSSDVYIEVIDGVKEGDIVLRNPRAIVKEARDEAPLEDRADERSQFGAGQETAAPNGGGPGEAGGPRDGGKGGGTRPGQSGGRFNLMSLDKDGDKKVSRQEAPEPMQAFFDTMDANKDGFIDAAEAAKARPPGGGGVGGKNRGGAGRPGEGRGDGAPRGAGPEGSPGRPS